MLFVVTDKDGGTHQTRSAARVYLLLLWFGVYPQHAVQAAAACRAGSARAMADVWQHVEPFGVTLDYSTGRKKRALL